MGSAASNVQGRAGRVEQTGVEFIPETERDSRPANLFAVFLGGNLAFSIIIFGWLPITFGLGWWSTISASAVGLLVGTALTAPLALLGPRTGTNNTVASGAHFGVTGRLIGSALTLAFALAYAAIAIWTSGDAIVGAAHRLLGTSDGDVMLGIGYALVSAEIVAVALLGHATVVAVQRFLIPILLVLLVLGIPAFAGDFHSNYAGGDYLLGGFWQTWALAVTVAASGPISYAPSLGDYSRRISSVRFRDRTVVLAVSAGVFLGLFITTAFGAFTAVAFGAIGESYVTDLVAHAPSWYVLPILVIAVVGGTGQGVLNLYASGLDLESLAPRLSRWQTTLITSVVAIALVYLGTFAFNAVDSITALTLVLNGISGPWIAVNLIGFFVARRRRYHPQDLQVFNEGRRGGRYWFTGGWNLRAVVAWSLGSVFGLLSVNTDLYVGPLSNLAGGIDLSLIGSLAISAVAYLAALVLWPERVDSVDDIADPRLPIAGESLALADRPVTALEPGAPT